MSASENVTQDSSGAGAADTQESQQSVLSHRNHPFFGQLVHSRKVIRLLKSINAKDVAFFNIAEKGIKIFVQEYGSFQVSGYIDANVFEDFKCAEPKINFKISLRALLEILQLFGGGPDVGAIMYLDQAKEWLSLIVTETGFHSDCRIRINDCPEFSEITFSNNTPVCRLICKSDIINEAFHDLLLHNSKTFKIFVRQREVAFSSEADEVVCDIIIHRDSEQIETYAFGGTERDFRYHSKVIKAAQKSLSNSDKVSIRVDKHGILALQFLIRCDEDMTSFVEIFCNPEAEMMEGF